LASAFSDGLLCSSRFSRARLRRFFENQCKHDGLLKIEKQNSRRFKLSMLSTTRVFIPGGGEHAGKIIYRG
jgi:hypothetical protein